MTGRSGGHASAIAAVTGAAFFWSTSYAVTKLLLSRLGPMYIGTVRFCVAALILGVAVLAGGRLRGLRSRDVILHCAAGLVGITLYFVVENYGVQRTTAGDASLIVAFYPLATAVSDIVVLRARVIGRQWAGMGLGMAGVAVITQQAGAHSGHRLAGDLLLIGGGAVWAGYNLIAKSAGNRLDPLTGTFIQTAAGAAGFLVATLAAGHTAALLPGPSALLLLLYLALGCSIGGFLLYNLGLRTLSSSSAVAILNLVPLFGVLSAAVIDGEHVSVPQLLGGGVVVVGVLLASVPRRADRQDDAHGHRRPRSLLAAAGGARIRPQHRPGHHRLAQRKAVEHDITAGRSTAAEHRSTAEHRTTV